MKAWRNVGGTIIQIDIDLDINNNPILPPDSTVDPKPDALPDHYVTIVDNAWVQIPIAQEVISFDYKKQQALEGLTKYKNWYLDQPVIVNSVAFDADETARNRLIQALVIYNSNAYLPPSWITANNTPYPLTTITDLEAIINGVQTAFSARFFEMDTIRQSIINAADEAALAAITIPVVPNQM